MKNSALKKTYTLLDPPTDPEVSGWHKQGKIQKIVNECPLEETTGVFYYINHK